MFAGSPDFSSCSDDSMPGNSLGTITHGGCNLPWPGSDNPAYLSV
jgi:hypothetical protein